MKRISDKFYAFLIPPGESGKYEEVKGISVKMVFGEFKNLDIFKYQQSNGRWALSEARTGLKVSEGYPLEEAIAEANKRFEKYGMIGAIAEMAKAVKGHGLSPRYIGFEVVGLDEMSVDAIAKILEKDMRVKRKEGSGRKIRMNLE